MKNIFLLLLGSLPFALWAQVPTSWVRPEIKVREFENPNQNLLDERISKILNFNQELLTSPKLRQSQSFELARFDAEIGVSLSGSIGILGLGKSSALEFIWERDPSKKEGDILVDVGDPEIAARDVKDHVVAFLAKHHLSDKKLKRILKRVDEMTAQSSRVMAAMLHMPQVGAWQASGLYHDFFFSINGDLLDSVSAGYDTRLRFRFKFKGTPVRYAQELKGLQKRLYRFMHALDNLSNDKTGSEKFKLKTVALKSGLEVGFDLEIFSLGLGQGYELRFDRVKDFTNKLTLNDAVSDVKKSLRSKELTRALRMSHSLVNSSERSLNETGDFKLAKIKTKFSFDGNVGVSLVSLEKSTGLELHYIRNEK